MGRGAKVLHVLTRYESAEEIDAFIEFEVFRSGISEGFEKDFLAFFAW